MTSSLPAHQRLARLLSIIPWVIQQPGGAELDEIVSCFDYPRDQLIADLEHILLFVGVYPFGPGDLIDVSIDDGAVSIRCPDSDWFMHPPRLSSQDKVRLFTAGAAALEATIGPDPNEEEPSPLLRALLKLGTSLGEDAFKAVYLNLGDTNNQILAAVRGAVAKKLQIELEYYTYGRHEFTYRLVDPVRVFSENGNWYLAGWCNKANDARVFRVDRIRSAVVATTVIGETDISDARAFSPKEDDPRVTLRLQPSASWVLDEYPYESAEPDGEAQIVKLVATSREWLERLLLRLGDTAELLESDQVFDADVRGAAARRILARYHAESAN